MKDLKGAKTILIVKGVLIVAGVSLAYFGVIKPIFNKLGITNSKEDRKGKKAQESLSKDGYFNASLYNNNKSRVSITTNQADYSATQIYDAKYGGCYGFCDNEEMAVNGIKVAKSLVDISFISNQFSEYYSKDLGSYLESFLENKNYTEIVNYIKTLKKF
ncbi:MAG: hypothetical protein ABF244_00605 [Flavobacteriaceae bacterium]